MNPLAWIKIRRFNNCMNVSTYDVDITKSLCVNVFPTTGHLERLSGVAYHVPMGGMLPAPSSNKPSFLIWATRDPNSGWLQRAQIIKGWVENGEAKESVFDVACGDGLTPDPNSELKLDGAITEPVGGEHQMVDARFRRTLPARCLLLLS